MRSGFRKFVQAQPDGVLHASPTYNVHQPACTATAKRWLRLDLTAGEFHELLSRVGYCKACYGVSPLHFLVYTKTVYSWALDGESQND